MKGKKADKLFLFLVLIMVCIGFIIFTSASMGLLSRTGGARFQDVAIKQFLILLAGLGVLVASANVNFLVYKRFALWIFAATAVFTALVFIPGVGLAAKGARRWIEIFGYSFQPAELLKIGYVTYLAFWLSQFKDKVGTFTYGFLPFIIITGIPAALLLAQPDTGTFMAFCAAGATMYFVGGGRWRHIFLLLIAVLVGIALLAYFRPYIKDRITTFIDPASDVRGTSHQINQSLIAIGSGGINGRGFGQSIQKFSYLPEPIGDSIFAVASEEFGLLGSSLLVILFLLFATLGLKIAVKTGDSFGRLLAVGLVILITAQSFFNMASMLGLMPLTGEPLLFVSHGGSALLVALFEVGIILNISKFKKA